MLWVCDILICLGLTCIAKNACEGRTVMAGGSEHGPKLHGSVGSASHLKGDSSLQSSRLSAIYSEVAPSLAVFGMLFGKALQAQVSCLWMHPCLRFPNSTLHDVE